MARFSKIKWLRWVNVQWSIWEWRDWSGLLWTDTRTNEKTKQCTYGSKIVGDISIEMMKLWINQMVTVL